MGAGDASVTADRAGQDGDDADALAQIHGRGEARLADAEDGPLGDLTQEGDARVREAGDDEGRGAVVLTLDEAREGHDDAVEVALAFEAGRRALEGHAIDLGAARERKRSIASSIACVTATVLLGLITTMRSAMAAAPFT